MATNEEHGAQNPNNPYCIHCTDMKGKLLPFERKFEELVKTAMAKPNGRLELPRRIKPGSELVRTWKRKTYRVMVMADGFAHDGRTFASLSEIASKITGTRWNGPRFFGLRSAPNRDGANGE